MKRCFCEECIDFERCTDRSKTHLTKKAPICFVEKDTLLEITKRLIRKYQNDFNVLNHEFAISQDEMEIVAYKAKIHWLEAKITAIGEVYDEYKKQNNS